MASSEEGELEDGEIEDEAGPENADSERGGHNRRSPRKKGRSGHAAGVSDSGGGGRESLRGTGGDGPRGFPHRRNSNNPGARYPAAVAAADTGLMSRARKRSLSCSPWDFHGLNKAKADGTSGTKRQRNASRERDGTSQRPGSSKDSRPCRRLKRRPKHRSRRPHARETEQPAPSSQDEYEMLLRKHHEVQELIKQEKEKLSSGGRSPGASGGGSTTSKGDRGQAKSSSAPALAKNDGATTSTAPPSRESDKGEIVEEEEQGEIIDVLDDDEEDDELLQLRLLALESATKNVTAREEKENQALKQSKQAKQRERRQKIKQLFHKQSIAAEISKVHGEGEVFSHFLDKVTRLRRKSLSSQGKNQRRLPSIGRESSKGQAASSTGEDSPVLFQFDNYEEVEMELSEKEDSRAGTPILTRMESLQDTLPVQTVSALDSTSSQTSCPSASGDVAGVKVEGEEEEEEEEEVEDEDDVTALREQLLRSLQTKRAAKAQASVQVVSQPEEYAPEEPAMQGPVYEPSPIAVAPSPLSALPDGAAPSASPRASSSPALTPRTQSPLPGAISGPTRPPPVKSKASVIMTAIPTHKPVVIQFGSDSSDDEELPQKPQMTQINYLDQFLKEQRHTADAKKSKEKTVPSTARIPQTPDAMRKLPHVQRAEYHKLKRELARLQQQKLDKLLAGGGSSPGTQSPIKGFTVSITKVDGKTKRTVRETDSKKVACEGTDKGAATKVEVTAAVPKETPLVKGCQGNLAKHRLMAEKDCRILTALDKQIQKQHSSLKQTEAKLQQLRDKLAVGEKIAASHRQQIKKYIQQQNLIRRKVQEHVSKESELRASLAKAKGVSLADVHRSKMLAVAAAQLPKATAAAAAAAEGSNGQGPAVPPKPKTQLQRLQRLERAYATQLSRLRLAGASPSRRPLPPSPVVRLLKTRTKLLNRKPSPQLLARDKIGLGAETAPSSGSGNTTAGEAAAVGPARDRGAPTQRRRSFLDLNPTLKPNLRRTANGEQSPSVTANSSRAATPKLADAGARKATAAATKSGDDAVETTSIAASAAGGQPVSKARTVVEGLVMPGQDQIRRLKCAHAEKWKRALEGALSVLGRPTGAAEVAEARGSAPGRAPNHLEMDVCSDPTPVEEGEDESIEVPDVMEYTSPLLRFRSYRLSPFFVKETKISRMSPSVSHKIEPAKVMCRYELNGTCNDDECPWQHRKDYEMSPTEVYADILAYMPPLAASKDWQDVGKREQRVADYVNRAVRKSRRPEQAKRQHEALCRAFANAALSQSKKVSPGFIVTRPRSWTPAQTLARPSDVDEPDLPLVPRGVGKGSASCLLGAHLEGEEQGRYYQGEGGIANLEAAALDRPEDVQTWLRLAKRIVGDDSEGKDVDRGLNALSRGLEANQASSELWLQYLRLYSRREDRGDLAELSQQALQFAPSYELFWQCLHFEKTFVAKETLCEQMEAYLRGRQSQEATEKGSHRLLEALLYRVQLHVMTRRVKASISLLSSALKGPGSLSPLLTVPDRCWAWLMYIHLAEFQCLPADVFDPTGSGIGHIVSKKPLIFQLRTPLAVTSPVGLRKTFQDALSACRDPDLPEADNVGNCLPLYRNLITLEHLSGRHDRAVQLCQKLLDSSPTEPQLWILLLDLHQQPNSSKTGLGEVVKKALSRWPRSAALYNAVAKSAVMSTADRVLRILRLCAMSYFSVPDKAAYESPEQIGRLYCSLLGQSVPYDFTAPELRPEVTPEVIQSQTCHLWMNYCLLQEMAAEESTASETYERSLCSLSQSQDVQTLWMEYLTFQKSKVASSQDKNVAFRTFTGLVHRCLVSTATRFPVPHSDTETWLDYAFHNRVVALFVACLKPEHHLEAYEGFFDRMPSNVLLGLRVCQSAVQSPQSSNSFHRVKSIAVEVLQKMPECLPVWKILIAVTLQQGKLKEAKALYQQALDTIPLAASLWKDLFLLEVVDGASPDAIRQLVLRCRDLKVNIEDYLKSILK